MKTLSSQKECCYSVAAVLLSATTIIINNSFASSSITTRNNCYWYAKRYVAKAKVYNYASLYGQTIHRGGLQLCYSQCKWQYSLFCCPYARNGTCGVYMNGYSNAWWCTAGNEYIPPTVTPSDGTGRSSYQFDQQVSFHGGQYGLIRIQKISDALHSEYKKLFITD